MRRGVKCKAAFVIASFVLTFGWNCTRAADMAMNDPKVAEAEYKAGNGYLQQGKYQEAVQAYTKALVAGLQDHQVHKKLGKALYMMGAYSEAINSYTYGINLGLKGKT